MITDDDRLLNYVTETLTRVTYQHILRRGDHALDVGANRGDHTAVMASIVSDLGIVHAFEPNIALLRGLSLIAPNIRVWPFAASNDLHRTVLHVPEGLDGWASQRDLTTELPNHTIRKVDTIGMPIDDLLGMIDPSRVRFIKIDVEKYEEQALKGMSVLIARSRAIIILENPTQAIDEFLTRFGYAIYGFDGMAWGDSKIHLPNVVAIPSEKQVWLSQLLPSPEEIANTIRGGVALYAASN
jgi:FkbM family methyltransferase